jgi:RNA polymerase sigma factor (TIGR02999 family)
MVTTDRPQLHGKLPRDAATDRGAFPAPEFEANANSLVGDIMPQVYDELRRVAASFLRGERVGHTLQRTALVHEAFLRLANERNIDWENRAHFLGICARVMRQTLTNYAVARQREKRGGSHALELAVEFYDRHAVDVTAVDDALRRLEELDFRQAQIVELRFFGGFTVEEIAEALNISAATVKREWTLAKIWLRRELSAEK